MIYSDSHATDVLIGALEDLTDIKKARQTAQNYYGTIPYHMEERQKRALESLREVVQYLLEEEVDAVS